MTTNKFGFMPQQQLVINTKALKGTIEIVNTDKHGVSFNVVSADYGCANDNQYFQYGSSVHINLAQLNNQITW